ncbi:accessory gene regulator B family protein [Defluviitalea saccharophila]|uniref:Accessory gene regulator B family protein n=1 Tax=Defluviitalea saccharophila TaxID=879970 RepID=A0ABZ2Y266_9FIRM
MSIIDHTAEKLAYQIKKASPNTDEQIVKYYYTRVLNHLIFYLMCIPLIILLNLKVSSFIIILISYTLLRRCFGGSHLESDIGCLILSLVTMLGGTWVSNYIKPSIALIIAIYMLTLAVIQWTGLVDSPKKRIVKLRAAFIRQGYFTIACLGMITFILYSFDKTRAMTNPVLVGIVIELVSLVIGKIRYR